VNNTGPTIFGKTITAAGVPIFTTALSGADSFDGEGSSSQGNTLAGSLTVTVMEVQQNGNLVIQATRPEAQPGRRVRARVGSGSPRGHRDRQHGHLRQGRRRAHQLFRPGVIDSSNRMGWLARFFNSAFAPY